MSDKALSDKKDTPLSWRLQARAKALKIKNDHVDEESDGWFAALPPEIKKDWREEEELVAEAAERVEAYEILMSGVVRAWESLPEGWHRHADIQKWIDERMVDAINRIRTYMERNP